MENKSQGNKALLGTVPILAWIAFQLLGNYTGINPTPVKTILFFCMLGLTVLAGLARILNRSLARLPIVVPSLYC